MGSLRFLPRLGAFASRAALVFVIFLPGHAQTIDRVAVVVGSTVYTESEVLDNLRITQFINREPLDLSPTARRAAANRLVDQELLHNEMKLTHFDTPPASQADTLLQEFVQRNYRGNTAAFETALRKYEITEDQLKQNLLWQLALMRFTEQRFRPELAPPNAATDQTANRVRPGAPMPPSDGAASTVDRQMDQWLQDARKGTKIILKSEAFQ